MNYVGIAYVASSLLNAAASAEVAYRYLRWWPSVRGGSILSRLVLGIGVAQTALTVITTARAVGQFAHPAADVTVESSIVLLALALLLAGTYLHLVPAWQMRRGFSGRHPAAAISWRVALVLAGLAWAAYGAGGFG